jgi:hypothetical protein
MYTPNTRLIDLTVSDLIEIIANVQKLTKPLPKDYIEKKYVYGLSGLASLLNCSRSAASSIKSSGKIDDAIIQEGRKIIIDSEKALHLLKQK